MHEAPHLLRPAAATVATLALALMAAVVPAAAAPVPVSFVLAHRAEPSTTAGPFDVNRTVLVPEQRRGTTVTVTNSLGESASVAVRDAEGRVVVRRRVGPRDTVDVRIPVKGAPRSAGYALVATAPGGATMTFPLIVARGWVPYSPVGRGTFDPCSTVSWSYVGSGRPPSTGAIKADIRGAFTRLAQQTGVTFEERPPGSKADIRIRWKDYGSSGPAGVGGSRISTGAGVRTASGTVTLNSSSRWPTARFAGFGADAYGNAGRGWLLVHELVHVLGLSHTTSRPQLMYHVNTGQRSFAAGDRAGLEALYPRTDCPG